MAGGILACGRYARGVVPPTLDKAWFGGYISSRRVIDVLCHLQVPSFAAVGPQCIMVLICRQQRRNKGSQVNRGRAGDRTVFASSKLTIIVMAASRALAAEFARKQSCWHKDGYGHLLAAASSSMLPGTGPCFTCQQNKHGKQSARKMEDVEPSSCDMMTAFPNSSMISSHRLSTSTAPRPSTALKPFLSMALSTPESTHYNPQALNRISLRPI